MGSFREPPAADSQNCQPIKRLPSRRFPALGINAVATVDSVLVRARKGALTLRLVLKLECDSPSLPLV